jgi:hypothetical protein
MRKTLKPDHKFTLRNFELGDAVVGLLVALLSYTILIRYVNIAPLRYLMVGVLTYIALSSWTMLKYSLPPRLLYHYQRWLFSPQLYVVAPDSEPRLLVIEMDQP